MTIIAFIAWLPYLLTYWPGFIFSDTMSSLKQSFGTMAWSNHHPFLYTMFIKTCLWLGRFIGIGNTGGCVIYCVIQMSFMAICFGYLSRWIVCRCKLPQWWSFVLVGAIALSPYIATYSIAFWKDPVFSVSLMALSPLLADFVFSRGKVVTSHKAWVPSVFFLSLVVMFSRNNGIYIMAALLFCILILAIVWNRKKVAARINLRKPLGALLLSILVVLLVTGSVYQAIGVAKASKAETVGVLLNQMARVAALDGEMNEDDAAYLNSIFPLEEYKNVYAPTCTDPLKWNSSFKAAPLNENFFEHWLSLLVKNPRIFFEAWELETFGFWTVNVPAVYNFNNIGGGVPRNTTERITQLEKYNITAENKLGNDAFRTIFTQDNASVPIGVIFWVVLYLAICMFLLKKKSWVLVLVPSLALLGTLIVASPIWYWPRYGAAVQFLIPFYAALAYLVASKRDISSPQLS